jgi:DNA polymerase II large subunit
MTMLMEKYNKLIELINNDNLAWVRHSGVPFVICPYKKEEHKDVIYIINKLKQEIESYHIELINMEQLIFDFIEEYETIDGVIELERSKEDIDMVEELGEFLLEKVRYYFISKAKEIGPKGRILVTRVGATAVYFNFIRLLSYLEGRVHIPVVFFYPGSYNRFSVTLLDKYKETALRALII